MTTYTATPVKLNGHWYAGTTDPVDADTGDTIRLRIITRSGKTWTKDHRVIGQGPDGRKLCEPLSGARKATRRSYPRRSYTRHQGGCPTPNLDLAYCPCIEG